MSEHDGAERVSEHDEETNEKMMTLIEHLLDLKDHLVRIAIALVICSAGSFVLAKKVLEWLLLPMQNYKGEYEVIATRPTTTIGLFMKISLFSGVIIAMPFIVYQVLDFVLPGLTPKERRALRWIIPGATLFFLSGAAFAYFVMVPAAIPFLLGFWHDIVKQNWMVDEYIPFVTGLLFWVGVSFETPLIMAFLSRLGVVTARQMLSVWKFAVVGIAVLAALITPTPDPFNMMLVMVPLVSLYFLGILLAWVSQPKGTQFHVLDIWWLGAATRGLLSGLSLWAVYFAYTSHRRGCTIQGILASIVALLLMMFIAVVATAIDRLIAGEPQPEAAVQEAQAARKEVAGT